MATLIDHTRRTITRGSVERLQALMVTAQLRKVGKGIKARERVAQANVRAAIRRGGRTDAGQELRMDDGERAAWELANPLSE